jgi:hypothetical protein
MSADIQTEIDALRAQLAEAEDMRRAIQHAEIDGFVIGDGDDDRYVHLLGPAYSRSLAEGRRRHQQSDERTRRFLSMLAIELLAMLKAMHGSLELVKREKHNTDSRRALDSLERHLSTMQRLAEDLRSINPPE